MTIPSEALLDTSVSLRFVVDHDDEDRLVAERLLGALTNGNLKAWILDLGVYEAVNLMARRFGQPENEIAANVADFFALGMNFIRIDKSLAVRAATVAAETGLSGYDAAHVAAAASISVPLITLDERIVRAAPAHALSLRSLSLLTSGAGDD